MNTAEMVDAIRDVRSGMEEAQKAMALATAKIARLERLLRLVRAVVPLSLQKRIDEELK